MGIAVKRQRLKVARKKSNIKCGRKTELTEIENHDSDDCSDIKVIKTPRPKKTARKVVGSKCRSVNRAEAVQVELPPADLTNEYLDENNIDPNKFKEACNFVFQDEMKQLFESYKKPSKCDLILMLSNSVIFSFLPRSEDYRISVLHEPMYLNGVSNLQNSAIWSVYPMEFYKMLFCMLYNFTGNVQFKETFQEVCTIYENESDRGYMKHLVSRKPPDMDDLKKVFRKQTNAVDCMDYNSLDTEGCTSSEYLESINNSFSIGMPEQDYLDYDTSAYISHCLIDADLFIDPKTLEEPEIPACPIETQEASDFPFDSDDEKELFEVDEPDELKDVESLKKCDETTPVVQAPPKRLKFKSRAEYNNYRIKQGKQKY